MCQNGHAQTQERRTNTQTYIAGVQALQRGREVRQPAQDLLCKGVQLCRKNNKSQARQEKRAEDGGDNRIRAPEGDADWRLVANNFISSRNDGAPAAANDTANTQAAGAAAGLRRTRDYAQPFFHILSLFVSETPPPQL